MVKSFADPSAHAVSEIFCMVPTVSSSLKSQSVLVKLKKLAKIGYFMPPNA